MTRPVMLMTLSSLIASAASKALDSGVKTHCVTP